jgi:hypothetical protein
MVYGLSLCRTDTRAYFDMGYKGRILVRLEYL